ncbi:MAG TPA: serine hydrolase domain-containing protein [Acidimicrobiia bacterium]|nr:serine hydrolase domain-containing protein [Acidimicrobiia bacterium]
MRLSWFAVLAVLVGVAGACSGGSRPARRSPPTAPPTVPGATWSAVPPASAGFDATRLDAIAKVAESGSSNCLVVTRDGRIAGEWYFRGTNASSAQDVYSATKSITSTLVGIAQDDGKLRVDDPASKWITEWQGTPSASVTIRNLLSNDSGREWSPAIDYRDLLRAPDRTAFAIGLGQAEPPGTVWAYNNSAIQTLQRVLQRATGEDVVAYAKQRLFDPLGMTETTMTRDRAGNAQMFEGVRSTCRDMARFGTLMLDGGRWGERRIVSSAWVRAATGAPSQPLNAGYGYLWWLNHEGAITNPLVATNLADAQHPSKETGRIAPGAPESMYWALGLGNQVVQVDPASRTVVVRLGTGTPRPKPPTFGPLEASKVVTDAVTGPASGAGR